MLAAVRLALQHILCSTSCAAILVLTHDIRDYHWIFTSCEDSEREAFMDKITEAGNVNVVVSDGLTLLQRVMCVTRSQLRHAHVYVVIDSTPALQSHAPLAARG